MPCARPATITAHSNENERKGEKKTALSQNESICTCVNTHRVQHYYFFMTSALWLFSNKLQSHQLATASEKKIALLLIIANTSHSYIFTLKKYRKRKKTQNAREITRTCACRPFAVGFLFYRVALIFARSPLLFICSTLTHTIEITHSILHIDTWL